ncbi:MAG TPA: oligosaccharide flippase family protein [Candidatus Paceibacterota bacterium]|nr:oligosaccharide flippase family protein [Candidatus Paceibacterota bacterium]
MNPIRARAISLLRWTERYTKTDMVYLVSSGFWSNLGILCVSFLALGLYSIYARYFTPSEFGIYQYFLTLAVLVHAFTLTGMNTALTRSVARGHNDSLKEGLRLQLTWSVLPFLVALAIALYYFVNGNSTFGLAALIIGVFTPLNAALAAHTAFLTGKKDFKRAFTYNFLGNIPYYGAMAAAAIFFQSALLVLLANCATNAIVYFVALRRTQRTYAQPGTSDPDMRSYGKHLSLINAPGIFLGQADILLAFHLLGPASVAVYSFATALPDQIARFLKFIPGAALPKFSTASHASIRASIGPKLVYAAIIAVLTALCYVVAAPFAYLVLFPQYQEAVQLSQLYAITVISLVTNIVLTVLIAQGHKRSLYLFNIALPLLQTGAQVLGILVLGVLGLVIAKIGITVLGLVTAVVLFFSIRSNPIQANSPTE